jgi:hypothetical protein
LGRNIEDKMSETIITAEEAKSIAYKFNHESSIKIENIFLLIKDAACQGKCQIIIDWPGWYIEDKLRELGFYCSIFTPTTLGKDFLISWK